jgi:insertion element IS1 protein InsB
VELRGLQKKPAWLWWAIDRTSHRVLGWALGDRDTRAARALGAQIPQGPGIRYFTDHWRCYTRIFPAAQLTQSKAHTHIIENMNNKLRCYLARLRRKTHCYSKSVANLRDSLLFVWQRKFGCPLTPASGQLLCRRLWGDDVSIPI